MSKPNQRAIQGFLIDIDGVLYVGESVIAGAREAIHFLNENNIPYLLVTNTTRKSRYGLHSTLQRLGFKITLEHIFSAPYAAAQWLKEKNAERIYLFLRGDAYREFNAFKITHYQPQYVVIGDIGEDLTYQRLNQAFRMVMNGAKMVALQKNRFWKTPEGLSIDAGAIVAALEYATGKRAEVIGKPRKAFFKQALAQLGLEAQHVAIIGDDLEADIAGGARAGLVTIAVKTGKFREEDLKAATVKPDVLLESIGQLPELFQVQSPEK